MSVTFGSPAFADAHFHFESEHVSPFLVQSLSFYISHATYRIFTDAKFISKKLTLQFGWEDKNEDGARRRRSDRVGS
jgi:hypothetical protein